MAEYRSIGCTEVLCARKVTEGEVWLMNTGNGNYSEEQAGTEAAAGLTTRAPSPGPDNFQAASSSPLDQIRIASPCPMSWDDLERTESEKARFCGQCRKNVYDIAQMSRPEAELFLQQVAVNMPGGTACLQIFRRADGTILTDDCPVGLKKVRNLWRRVRLTAASVIALLVSALPVQAGDGPGCAAKDGKSAKNQGVGTAAGGDKKLVPLLGSPAPLPVSGSIRGEMTAPVNWEERALAVPELKSLIEKVKGLEAKGAAKDKEKAAIVKLKLKIANLADKKNLPYYGSEQLAKADTMASAIKGDRSLLREVLQARLKNARLLRLDSTEIQRRLDALGG